MVSLAMTSCFEITEEITLNVNGSGNMAVTLNMSESKDNLKEYLNAGEINGQKIPDQKELNSFLNKMKESLAAVKGISNVQQTSDFNEFIFTFTGDFTNVKAMNTAVDKLTKEVSRGMLTIENSYEYANGKFTRSFGRAVDPKDYDSIPIMQRFVLESARMVSIYRFNKPVKKVSNIDAVVSPSKKAVKFESTLGDIAKGAKTVENTVSF